MQIRELRHIKRLTRLALPKDDSYLYRLGVALYGFASINSFMCEIISHIDKFLGHTVAKDNSGNYIELNHTLLQDKTSGEVLNYFRRARTVLKSSKKLPVIYQDLLDTAGLFEKLNTERTDFVHTYPITNKKGEQILHRRKDLKGKYFEVDNIFLDNFIGKLHDVSIKLHAIRKVVRPDL